jgi:hypothetical protein
MRRLLLFALPASAALWLFVGAWASCVSDDYRDVLPFRGYDAAPRDLAGQDLGSAPVDMTRPAVDLGGTGDGGGTVDGGTADGGTADGGTPDAGAIDGGMTDGGMADGGMADGGMTG